MQILLDTNILLRLAETGHPHFSQTSAAVETLTQRRHELLIVPQVLCEFWVVATRPVESNGLGMSPAEARRELDAFKSLFRLLRDERRVFAVWEQLVTTLDVKGKQAHDARLVAAMTRFSIPHLLTHKYRDFLRYLSITAHSPADVLNGSFPVEESL